MEQSAWAIELSPELPPGPVLELCAGVGHIGLVVAQVTRRALVQVDADPHACELAVENAAAAHVKTDVRAREIEDAVGPEERFVIVLADPPYVPSAEVDRFPDDPPAAIDGGPDGLDVVRRCLAVAAAHLAPGGVVLLQLLDEGQASRLDDAGLRVVDVRSGERGCVVMLCLRPEAPA